MVNAQTRVNKGFTIVELLVVIIVIGILASITIVSYVGITRSAISSSLQSDLTNASKSLDMYQVENDTYPVANNCIDQATNEICLEHSPKNNIEYHVNNNSNQPVFCVTANQGDQYYMAMSKATPLVGGCPSYSGLLLYLDAAVSASYSSSGTTWADLSGNNHTGTLISGASYSSDSGGLLSFDGINDFVKNSQGGLLPTGNSERTISFWFKANEGMTSSDTAFGYGCIDEERFDCVTETGKYVGAYATTTRIGMQLESCMARGPDTPNPKTGWHFYTVVFNGGNILTFYVDGGHETIVDSSDVGLWSCDINTKPGMGYTVGSGRWGYYDGKLNNIVVQNRVLNSSEVLQYYNALRGRYGV